MEVPRTHYARSGEHQIAYQVVGEGELDIVLVPSYLSNTEMFWEMPSFAKFYERLASFSRLILFDRRGSGMSDGIAGATPLEEQIDDVQAVVDAAGCKQPVILTYLEGCGLAVLYAASHPAAVRALVLVSPQPRLVAGPGYEWAPTLEERAAFVQRIVDTWGTDESPMAGVVARDDPRQRPLMARIQRLSMSPSAAAAVLAMIGETDVRDVLPSVQCPTLVLRPEHDTYLDERHSLYVAEHVPGARYVHVPGDGALWVGAEDQVADEIQHFLTGMRRLVETDRVLATVLFTDIVGSTERAAAIGDEAWRALLEKHDRIVREEVVSHRGHLVKSLGDGVLALFDGPSRAVGAAAAIRDRVRPLDLEVRAGLHTGECEMMPGDVGGIAVHIGARISALAGPGEILVSSTVRDLTVGSGLDLADRGEHELKGVPGTWRIFAAADAAGGESA